MDLHFHSNATPAPATPEELYELIGGMETCRRIAAAFYARVDVDPLLRPMFPHDLQQAIEHLALFLAQRFGGPEIYASQRGHPRLRMRHRPFQIGQAERDAWLGHMLAAMREAGVEEPAYSLMQRYFEDSATFLINAGDIPLNQP
jgi:hemoglobin